jgi:hypothetical protein
MPRPVLLAVDGDPAARGEPVAPVLADRRLPDMTVRRRSVKRVAAAVGEGSAAIRTIHQYLSQE